jgi:cytochrome c oxidase subunit 1
MWSGRLRMTAAMHFIYGFLFIFVIGGMTGVMLASIPLDLQSHDTFFVVAHFHYVLIGGALFPLFGAFHFWFPKITGKMIDEKLGKVSFWLLFIGFNTTFFPMHILGLNGMTRRIYTYAADMNWGNANLLATLGAFVIALGGIVFIVNASTSLRAPGRAEGDPWEASTLEWATSSPPPNYNFVYQPVVSSRAPLWTDPTLRTVVTGMRTDRREVMVTGVTEAEPQFRMVLPGPSIWPFLSALGLGIGLAGSVFAFSWYFVASALGGLGLVGWFWPRGPVEIEP